MFGRYKHHKSAQTYRMVWRELLLKEELMKKLKFAILAIFIFLFLYSGIAFATPTTYIWTPSTDIQPYGKIHLNIDNYTSIPNHDPNGNKLYVQQVYGPTFSLLSDKPEGNGLASDSQSHKPEGNGLASDSQSHNNLLGKLWSPLDKVMAETGFDYKKGLGSVLDEWPVYFHFKFGVPEDVYFKNMPAFAFGIYDMGYKHNKTDNNVLYYRAAKTILFSKFNLGRFSAGYFNGNGRVLLDENSQRDNNGVLLAWDRVMTEISDRLWLCLDYQGSHSSYGAMNYGFSWKFTDNVSAIVGYDIYNNKNLRPTITFQLDLDF